MEEDIKEKIPPQELPNDATSHEVAEVKEVSGAEKEPLSAEQLNQIKETIEGVELDDAGKTQAASSAQAAALLPEKEKLEMLIGLAKKKGVVVAVQAAKKMNDPYVLDMLHDALAKGGQYKEFLK